METMFFFSANFLNTTFGMTVSVKSLYYWGAGETSWGSSSKLTGTFFSDPSLTYPGAMNHAPVLKKGGLPLLYSPQVMSGRVAIKIEICNLGMGNKNRQLKFRCGPSGGLGRGS